MEVACSAVRAIALLRSREVLRVEEAASLIATEVAAVAVPARTREATIAPTAIGSANGLMVRLAGLSATRCTPVAKATTTGTGRVPSPNVKVAHGLALVGPTVRVAYSLAALGLQARQVCNVPARAACPATAQGGTWAGQAPRKAA